jgi:hypothetical protein
MSEDLETHPGRQSGVPQVPKLLNNFLGHSEKIEFASKPGNDIAGCGLLIAAQHGHVEAGP